VFGFDVMRDFAESVGADLEKLPDRDDLDDSVKYICPTGSDRRESHADKFLLLMQRAAATEYLDEHTHWRLVKPGKSGEELRFNVPRCFDAVSRYVQDHGISVDLLGSPEDYSSRYSELCDDQESYVESHSQPTTGINRAVGIDRDSARKLIDGFDPSVFTTSTDHDHDSDSDSDSNDGGDGDSDSENKYTPVSSIHTGGGYETVSVEVIEYCDAPDTLVEAGGPAKIGELKDESGRIDVCRFDGEEPDGEELLEPGETVEINGCPVTSHDQTPQLTLDSDTEITRIQTGVGYTPRPDPDPVDVDTGETKQTMVHDHDSDSDSDLSQRDRIRSVIDVVREHDSDPVSVETVVDICEENGMAVSKVEHEIDRLKHKGELYEPEDGRLRTV